MNLEEAIAVSETGDRLSTAAAAPVALYTRVRAYLTLAGVPEPELTRACVTLVADAAGGAGDPMNTLMSRAEHYAAAAGSHNGARPSPGIARQSMMPRPFAYAGVEWRARLPRLLARVRLLRARIERPVPG